MSRERTLKNRIISIIPLYVSKECPAYYELKQAIEGIADEKFMEIMNQKPQSISQQIHHLIDDIFFFINDNYQITHAQGEQLDSFINEIRGGPRHRTLGGCKMFLGGEKHFWGGVKIFLGEHKNFF